MSIRIKNTILLLTILCSITSCGTHLKSTPLNPSTGYFTTHKKNTPVVTTANSIKQDSLKSTVLVIANKDDLKDYMMDMGNNLNRFDTVMHLEHVIDCIKNKHNFNNHDTGDFVSFNEKYHIYILELNKLKKTKKGWFAVLTLHDKKIKQTIFRSEIKLNLMWDGWTDQATMYPLFNSLIDYLDKNE